MPHIELRLRKMSRRYKPNAARKHFVYSVQDIMALYSVSQNTVSNWGRSGLRPGDNKRPYLFRGEVLNLFHAERRARTLNQLRPGEFKCLTCKAAVFPDWPTLKLSRFPNGRALGHGMCPDCGANIQRILSETECDMFKNRVNPNNSQDFRHESNVATPAGIGITRAFSSSNIGNNDRIIHEWQLWAARYSETTRAAHLSAIRDFEGFIEGKDFRKIGKKEVSEYRNALLGKAKLEKSEGGLSRSTIGHRASQLSEFLKWLAKQKDFKHLITLNEWLQLTKSLQAQADVKPMKPYPKLDEAQRALNALPVRTLKERRDKAIFAAAFATGLREHALVTLRRQLVDPRARTVRQDGNTMRAKNGKSYTAHWFPRTEGFQDALLAWIEEVDTLGMRGADALFPSNENLRRFGRADAPIAPMMTASAVDAVFKAAWSETSMAFTPHSARHTLKKLGDELCFTPQARKAWSQNLGHSNESTTVKHYGKMTWEEQCEVFEGFDRNNDFTLDEMRLMLAYHAHELTKGTPEFAQGEMLAERYKQNRK